MDKKKKKMNQEQNNLEILVELKRITKLLVLIATQTKMQSEKMITLQQLGFSPKEIGDLLGVSSNLVRVTLHQVRKKKNI
jgi:DNA-directed RNA polymerase specialized sigma24 family protein